MTNPNCHPYRTVDGWPLGARGSFARGECVQAAFVELEKNQTCPLGSG